MNIITLDYETYWDSDYTLKKLSPLEYVLGDRFEVISCAIKCNGHPTDVFFGHDEVGKALKSVKGTIESGGLLAHNNSGFDAYVSSYVYGLKPKLWMCTSAMARPIHAKTTGLSLAKLVEHYSIGHKDGGILMQVKGRGLADFTLDEIEAMRTYNKADADQCWALFNELERHFTARDMWQIDALTRMRTEPKFEVDTAMLETALSIERDQKRKHIYMLAKMLQVQMQPEPCYDGADSPDFADHFNDVAPATEEEAIERVRAELASAPKFAKLLESRGVEVPMKPSPTNPEKQVPALAKSDEAFTDLQEHEDPVVAAAARARLAVKSTLLETRIGKFLTAARLTGGLLPMPLRYAGADTTGRDSGEEYNPQNLPRVNPGKPKTSDALRKCLRAPAGYKVVVADLSGIELRVNHFLWQVPGSMEMYQADREADLYKDFASARYGVPVSEVTKDQRQMGKVAHLGLGFGAGPPTFKRFAKVQYGLDIPEAEAFNVVQAWRAQYAEIPAGWKKCNDALKSIYRGVEEAVDPWGMVTTCREGLRLPSGRLIRYPDLRVEVDGQWPDGGPKKSWFYAHGRHKARNTGPKTTENIVQALAADVVFGNAVDFFKASGFRPQLRVHDELVYVVPESEAQRALDALQKIMRTPPTWWPELVTFSEGDIADTYGDAK